jgi:hypothetical protein
MSQKRKLESFSECFNEELRAGQLWSCTPVIPANKEEGIARSWSLASLDSY